MELGDGALGPRERAVLTALIVRCDESLRPGELAEALWGDDLPSTWTQQIRNAVARIRARLGAEAVVTWASTYRLGVDPGTVDAVRFERLVTAARGQVLDGDDARAIDAYRRALGLWRGMPLQDVAGWPPGDAEARRLLEIRDTAEEELLDARLRAGDHRAVLADAERLVRAEPLREDRWAILALASYRSGRQAEALAAIRAARLRLGEDLGIEPGPRLSALETAVLRQDPHLDAPSASAAPRAQCPYPGLRPFGPDDAEMYFGREGDVGAVMERLRPRSLVTVAGPSGAGKSSLVLAGIVPRLRASGRPVEIVAPGADVAARLRMATERAAVVVIDQAEELLQLGEAERADVGAAAAVALSDGRVLLLTARSDSLDGLRTIPGVGDAVGGGIHLLGPITIVGCREAIVEPARHSGLRLEPGLVELALRDVGGRSGTLPHLSHALRETWVRREGDMLTVSGYEASGGIAGAISKSADTAFQSFTPHEQELCRSLFLRLLERREDGTVVRRRMSVEAVLVDPDRRRVVEALTSVRLLSVDGDAVVVAHEAVADAWPRLDGWLAEDVDRARAVRVVEAASAAWAADGRSDDDLLRGARLQHVLAAGDGTRDDLTPLEREFLDDSADREQSATRAAEATAARERARNRALRAALGIAAGLLGAAVVAGTIAAVRGGEARAANESARIETLVATSLALRTSDRELAALLAAEAFRHWPDDDRVRSALLGIVMGADGLMRRTAYEGSAVTTPIPGTDDAVQVLDDDHVSVRIVGIGTGAVRRELDVAVPQSDAGFARSLAVSADGGVAVVQTPFFADAAAGTCCRNHLVFVDLATGEELGGTQMLEARTTYQLAFSADGTTLYTGNPVTHDLQAIDVRTGAVTVSSPDAFGHAGEEGTADSIALADPARVVVGAGDELIVYDAADVAEVARIATPGDVTTLGLAPDGTGGVVAAGPDGVARIDPSSGEVLWHTRPSAGRECQYLAVISERGTVFCSRLGSVAELDLATGVWTGHERATSVDEFVLIHPLDHGDAMYLDAPLASATQLWRLDGSGPASRLVARGRHLAGGLDASGSLALTSASTDGPFQQWDLEADLPVGEPAQWLSWIGPAQLERWSEAGGLEILGAEGGSSTLDPAITEALGPSVNLRAGTPGPHAYAFADAVNTFFALDPETGVAMSPPLEIPGLDDGSFFVNGVSASADGSRVAVTYYDAGSAQTLTAIIDPRDGALVAKGLPGTEGNAITTSGALITAGDTAVTRNDLDSLEPQSALPKAFSSGNAIEVSDDEATMLIVGWDNRAALYGLDAAVKLGDTMDTVSLELAQGAHLSRDGGRLVTGSEEGLLVWTLDPARHARAACDLAGRELTAIEWSTYFPDEQQRPTCDDVAGR